MVKLGQNFLVDRNILDVIERLAELSREDVVLEIGGGLGVLSERLAQRTRHVHVIELDQRLEPGLRDLLADNATLHIADALELDLTALDPPPTKVVANLPYGIAATAILRTIDELPSVESWVVMVQREVGERLAGAPGTPAYGVPSVLAQLAADVKVLRPISRTVFRPVPNVDSVLVGLRRRPGIDRVDPALRALVHHAFAHRRKALAGSLALAPNAPSGIRERARDALVAIGHPADERAERLTPEEFRELAIKLAQDVRAEKTKNTIAFSAQTLTESAPGKVNLCLFLGPTRADGRHELVTVLESVSLADELSLTAGVERDQVVCPGIEGPNLVSTALSMLRERGWDAPPVRIEIRKRVPVAAGMGGGSADAAAALRLAARLAPVSAATAAEVAAALGSDVPSQLVPGLHLGSGAGELVTQLVPLPEHAYAIVPLPHALSTADVYREADRLGLGRGAEELRERLATLKDGEQPPIVNDLEPASRSLCPAIEPALSAILQAGAEAAFVSGSGPTCAGLWWGDQALARAAAAATSLGARFPGASAVAPVPFIGHNSPFK
jgi:16S rRNA (adenine1518-N6/adenine1519-N6)-dimethyltransferase